MKKVKKYLFALVFTLFTSIILIGCSEKVNIKIDLEKDLVAGRTYELNISADKKDDANFQISLSKEGIISVDEKNKSVEALAEGTVELTVSLDEKNSVSIEITVKPAIKYSIEYKLDGGALENSLSEYDTLNKGLELPVPTKEGYTFKGWYETSDFSSNLVDKIEKGTEGNKVFYAKWEKIDVKYTITFNANGGSEVSTIEYYNESEEITLPEPTKEGYNFIGWYEDENFTGEKVITIAKGTARNITLYAKWEKIVIKLSTPVISGESNESNVKITFVTDTNAKSYRAIIYKNNVQYSKLENFKSGQEITF